MRRDQTAHEWLIPAFVDLIGASSYLELGTHLNETISRVNCQRRYGVDIKTVPFPGVKMFQMTTREFIRGHAAHYAPYDVCFIDADHSAEALMQDFMGIMPLISSDGLVLAHDCNPELTSDAVPGYCGDGWISARAIVEGGWEAMVLPYHPGLMIARKRVQWGPRA